MSIRLGVDILDPPPLRKDGVLRWWPRRPNPGKVHRIALLAGTGIDTRQLRKIAEGLYQKLQDVASVVLVPEGTFGACVQSSHPDEVRMMREIIRENLLLPHIPDEHARAFTMIDLVFRHDNKVYRFERLPPQ